MPTNRNFLSIVLNWSPDQYRDLEEQYRFLCYASPEPEKRTPHLNQALVFSAGKAYERFAPLIDQLVQWGAKPSECPQALQAALESGDLKMASHLTRLGCCLQEVDTDVIYPLCFSAAQENSHEMLSYLLPLDDRIDEQIRWECLELAATAGSFESVRALLQFSFSQEHLNEAANLAAENDHFEVVVLLTWHGADPHKLPSDLVARFGL